MMRWRKGSSSEEEEEKEEAVQPSKKRGIANHWSSADGLSTEKSRKRQKKSTDRK